MYPNDQKKNILEKFFVTCFKANLYEAKQCGLSTIQKKCVDFIDLEFYTTPSYPTV